MADNIVGLIWALGLGAFAMYMCYDSEAPSTAVWCFMAFVSGIVTGLRLMRIITHKKDE